MSSFLDFALFVFDFVEILLKKRALILLVYWNTLVVFTIVFDLQNYFLQKVCALRVSLVFPPNLRVMAYLLG